VAPLSTLEHPKTMLSTLASTLKGGKQRSPIKKQEPEETALSARRVGPPTTTICFRIRLILSLL
jgi:hypothetical protein